MDCSEVFVQIPSSLANKSLPYRDYKSLMSFYGLLGIKAEGVTILASGLWGGSISDN